MINSRTEAVLNALLEKSSTGSDCRDEIGTLALCIIDEYASCGRSEYVSSIINKEGSNSRVTLAEGHALSYVRHHYCGEKTLLKPSIIDKKVNMVECAKAINSAGRAVYLASLRQGDDRTGNFSASHESFRNSSHFAEGTAEDTAKAAHTHADAILAAAESKAAVIRKTAESEAAAIRNSAEAERQNGQTVCSEANNMLTAARAQAGAILAEAENEASVIRKAAEGEAAAIRNSAEAERLSGQFACSEANNMLTAARTQADAILAAAENEASVIRKAAESKAAAIRNSAEAERQSGQFADSEATNMLKAARAQADAILAKAGSDAAKIRMSAEDQASAEYNRLIRQHLNDYQQRVLEETVMAVPSIGEGNLHDALRSSKEQLCTEIDRLKLDLRNSTEEMMSRLREQQERVTGAMRDIQRSLYHHEFYDIARSYCQLYLILHSNPALTEQLAADGDRYAPDSAENIINLKASLTTTLNTLGKGLEKLGLRIFFPEKNARFDDVLFSVADGGHPAPEAMVTKCLSPGITTADEYGIPVIKAVVQVGKSS